MRNMLPLKHSLSWGTRSIEQSRTSNPVVHKMIPAYHDVVFLVIATPRSELVDWRAQTSPSTDSVAPSSL
jgi:hypothetical protein